MENQGQISKMNKGPFYYRSSGLPDHARISYRGGSEDYKINFHFRFQVEFTPYCDTGWEWGLRSSEYKKELLVSFGWIDAKQFSFNTLLLMDRWIFRVITKGKENPEFRQKFAVALAGNPVVFWYIINKCPEDTDFYRELVKLAPTSLPANVVRDAEVYILDALDWAVVYMYPEIMEKLSYIAEWDKERLLSITDFTGKTVLDIGAGTGRLAFAAAPLAKYVYASEPVDRLREYMREKVKRLNINNIRVLDGAVEELPFEDGSFDIVMSGHVIGDNYQAEWQEMSRVTKPGGWVIDCPGENDRKKPDGPAKEMIELEFSFSHYVSKTGGDVYRYWRQK